MTNSLKIGRGPGHVIHF